MFSDTTAPAEDFRTNSAARAAAFWHTDASPSAFPVGLSTAVLAGGPLPPCACSLLITPPIGNTLSRLLL